MTHPPVHVLFVSRRHTARSVIAECCMNFLGAGRFKAHGCGAPRHLGASPHPAVLEALNKTGIPAPARPCRDWSAFSRNPSVRMDYVILLAEELSDQLPAWPGQPLTATWAYADVVTELDGKPLADSRAVWTTLLSLRRRIELLISLPVHRAARADLQADIRDLAQMR